MTKRTRVPEAPHIDAAIEQLQRLDDMSIQLFENRLSVETYRKRVAELIMGMTGTAIRMFAAPYVDEFEVDRVN